jgi:hypothetical protein
MRLVDRRGRPLAELRSDGAILGNDGRPIGRLLSTGDRIVDQGGTSLLSVAADGSVRVGLDPNGRLGQFDPRGTLIWPWSPGEAVWVDDTGAPSWTVRGTTMFSPEEARFVPFYPAARRTAEAVFFVVVVAAWSHGLPG